MKHSNGTYPVLLFLAGALILFAVTTIRWKSPKDALAVKSATAESILNDTDSSHSEKDITAQPLSLKTVSVSLDKSETSTMVNNVVDESAQATAQALIGTPNTSTIKPPSEAISKPQNQASTNTNVANELVQGVAATQALSEQPGASKPITPETVPALSNQTDTNVVDKSTQIVKTQTLTEQPNESVISEAVLVTESSSHPQSNNTEVSISTSGNDVTDVTPPPEQPKGPVLTPEILANMPASEWVLLQEKSTGDIVLVPSTDGTPIAEEMAQQLKTLLANYGWQVDYDASSGLLLYPVKP